jgi:predicted short-subunit dehydrogenase-like oxidoreductase (DUF2520 family)
MKKQTKKRKPLTGFRVVMIGAGNVATHLSAEFENAGAEIVQTIRRTAEQTGKKFSKTVQADIKNIRKDADLYVICVPDDSIAAVAKAMPVVKGDVVHTSGSVPMNVLKKFRSHGVFYPLQSFSKDKKVTVNAYAICIEASSKQVAEDLMELAGGISKNAYLFDSKQREVVHLAAVFANNFSNHMFSIAEGILQSKKLPLEVLKPLILEGAFKLVDSDAKTAQTGPAKRGDTKTMKRHLEMLKNNEELSKLYKRISKQIAS